MRKEKRHMRYTKHVRKTLSFLGAGIILGLLGLASIAVIYIAVLIKNLPSPDQLGNQKVNQSTKIYDRTGEILLYEIHGEEKRTLVPFEEIPKFIKDATLAAEDITFYTEPAFNWKGILRAFLKNLQEGRITQGGSTISQQLVKNVFLSSERTYTRKIKELVLAIELESKYTKDQIFSFYLNQIPYGSNAYGVEAASKTFFNKSVKELTLGEGAILASLVKAPSYYSPWGSRVKELIDRKDQILEKMTSAGLITQKEMGEAKKQTLKFAPPSLGSIKAPHFVLTIKEQLINKFGENIVMNGGLRVISTLDWPLQELAEKVVEEGVKRNEELYNSKNGALVAQDAKTGQILAFVGSRNYFDLENEGNFNIPTQGLRQPGSALKPFVYMTAFQKGFSPKTIVYDVSTEFDTRNTPETSYRPQNFDEIFRGPVRLEQALAQSLNIPAVKSLYLAGFDAVLKNLHSFGITTLNERWRYGLSLTLGGGEIKQIDLLNAYATLSQEGVRHDQAFILKVEDSEGKILEEYQDKTDRVTDPQYPRLISQILSDSELRSPVFQASLPLTVFQGRDVALKTGTTEDYRDAWAFGYTPSLAIGVWTGNNDNTPMKARGSSILAAIPIWNAFLKEALLKYPEEAFQKPDPIILPSKPMLNGESEFVPTLGGKKYPQIHSILYYIAKGDPLGSIPENPFSDSQFENWEKGVLEWCAQNIPNFYTFNQPIPDGATIYSSQTGTLSQPIVSSQGNELKIIDLKPKSGEFLSSPFKITANLEAREGLQEIQLYFNRRLISSFGVFGNRYHFEYSFQSPLESQNLFELKVKDMKGNEVKDSLIIFH